MSKHEKSEKSREEQKRAEKNRKLTENNRNLIENQKSSKKTIARNHDALVNILETTQ